MNRILFYEPIRSAVIGASGSGKSSLAAAGLLSAILERGALPDSTRWLCVQCRPDYNPWESLPVALASHSQLAPHFPALDALVKAPEQEAHRLHLLARLAFHGQPDSYRLIVFVDQFEEFFALYNPEQDKDGQDKKDEDERRKRADELADSRIN